MKSPFKFSSLLPALGVSASRKLNRNELILTYATVVVIILALNFTVLKRWRQKAAELGLNLSQMEEKVRTNRVSLEEIGKQIPSAFELGTSNQILKVFNDSNDKTSSFISEIYRQSEKSPVKISRVSMGKQSPGKDYVQTEYELEAQASFVSLGQFLERLGDSSLLTDVDTVEIYRMENELKQCAVKIKLMSYVLER